MGWFILAIVFFVIAAILVAARFIISPHDKEHAAQVQKDYRNDTIYVNGRRLVTGIAAGVTVIALIFLGLSTMRSVPVHSVGVKTAFGKINGSLRPGISFFNAPWTSVYVLDETVQTTSFYGNSKGGNCLQVRIGGQQLACLNITVKWQIEDPAAPGLFNQYDNPGANIQDSITNNLVVNQLRATTNDVMGDYNPIQDVSATVATGKASAPSLFSSFGPEILTKMRTAIGKQISILSITLSNAYYNSTTEARLASIQNQFADTAIAQQEVATNLQLAKANNNLSRSLTPSLVQYNCETITEDIIKTGGKLPNGWSCFGASSVVAGG